MQRQLERWNRGDQLSADALNGNFALLYELATMAMVQARQPDPGAIALAEKTGKLVERIEALEKLTAMHAHQRNEKQYVPLSYLGGLITQVNDLRQEVKKSLARIEDLYAGLRVDHDNLHARLLRVEQQADASDKQLLAVLQADHERLAVDACGALSEIVETRHGDA